MKMTAPVQKSRTAARRRLTSAAGIKNPVRAIGNIKSR